MSRGCRQAGFAPETVFNLGSLKYDVAEREALDAVDVTKEKDISAWWDRTGWNGEERILLGGSTHPGEEEVLARIYRDLRDGVAEGPARPRPAPCRTRRRHPRHVRPDGPARRHPHPARRRDRAAGQRQLARSAGGQLDRRTWFALQAGDAGFRREKPARTTAGRILSRRRRSACRSWSGQTCKISRSSPASSSASNAVVQVTDEFELAKTLHMLFASDETRKELGARAQATFQANLGAAKKTAEVIVGSLATPGEAHGIHLTTGRPGTRARGWACAIHRKLPVNLGR